MGRTIAGRLAFALFVCALALPAQVIEFEANGLKYQTLTRNGLTIMFAQLQSHVRDYSILQVAIANGSGQTHVIRPESFVIERTDGSTLPAVAPRVVIGELVDKAGRNDVIRLVTAYESSLYGNHRYRATNGYELRRQQAFAEVSSTKIKAAAAASAIALVPMKLAPGESTDGAVFYAAGARPLGPGKLTVKAAGAVFEFPLS
jgi:hypothetical protein